MPTAAINGVDLAYDEAGTGYPLLLMHAGICDRRMWDDVMPALAERFRAIRFDFRGYGDTPETDGTFEYAADAAALLDHLGVARAHVIGVSVGGHIAIDLALSRPNLIERLMLVAPGIGGWENEAALQEAFAAEERAYEAGDLDEAAWVNVRTWLDGPTRGPDEVEPELRRRVFEMQRHIYDLDNENGQGGWVVPDRHLRLAEINAPTLVAVGDLDQPDFVKIARHIAGHIPNARMQVLPGVAHLPPMEAPEDFTRLAVEFLEAD